MEFSADPITLACVGSRSTPADMLVWMERMGAEFVRRGYFIASGNAPGADQAWARGANSVDPMNVTLYLPWSQFEAGALRSGNRVTTLEQLAPSERDRYRAIAEQLHPQWRWLTSAGQRLHTRNVALVEASAAVVGYPDPARPGGGGTGGAFRAARFFRRPTFDISDAAGRARLLETLRIRESS